MKKVLIIAHTTELSLRKRLREIGFVLSKYYQVYFLNWNEPSNKSFGERVRVAFKDIFKKSRVYEKEGILYAEYPFFHRPFFMIKLYNSYSLERFLIKYNIDVVINGVHYFFFTPKSRKYTYKHIFDVNDLPAEDIKSHSGHFNYEFARHEAQKANVVTACSQGLVNYIQEQFDRQTYFIPNGTYLEKFKKIDYEEVKKIRIKHNLLNKFVIGYIGKVDEWIDINFLISFFKVLKTKYTDVALMIVGSGPKIDFYKDKIRDKNIVFTGGIPHQKITPYFFSIDTAVLPSKKNLFQDLAFHIKLIEYTAAKKMVISSPLEEVKRLGFPNILIADFSMGKWLKAIDRIRQMQWNSEWDNLVEKYDWSKMGEKFIEIIEKISDI